MSRIIIKGIRSKNEQGLIESSFRYYLETEWKGEEPFREWLQNEKGMIAAYDHKKNGVTYILNIGEPEVIPWLIHWGRGQFGNSRTFSSLYKKVYKAFMKQSKNANKITRVKRLMLDWVLEEESING